MGLIFDSSYPFEREGHIDENKLYLQPKGDGKGRVWVVKYAEDGDIDASEDVLHSSDLQELMAASANNGDLPQVLKDRGLDKIARDPRFKKLARSITGIETETHKNRREEHSTILQRAFEGAKRLGKGLVKIANKGLVGKIVRERYWKREITSLSPWFKTLSETERQELKVGFRDGKLVKQDAPFSTKDMTTFHSGDGYCIFVVDPDENIYCSSHKAFVFHHSSFMGLGATIAAGEIKTDDEGNIIEVSNKSGHYIPNDEQNLNLLKIFQKNNIDISKFNFSLINPPIKLNALVYLKILEKQKKSPHTMLDLSSLYSLSTDLQILLNRIKPKDLSSDQFFTSLFEETQEIIILMEGQPSLTFSEIINLEPTLRKEILQNSYKIAYSLFARGILLKNIAEIEPPALRSVIISKGNKDLFDDDSFRKELAETNSPEVITKAGPFYYHLKKLSENGVTLSQILAITPQELSFEIINCSGSVTILIENGGSLEDILRIDPPELRSEIIKNMYKVSELLKRRVKLSEIVELPTELRNEIIENGGNFHELLERGVTFSEIIELKPPSLRSDIIKNGNNLSKFIDKRIEFSRIITLTPQKLRAEIIRNSYGLSLLLDNVDFSEIIEVEPEELRYKIIKKSPLLIPLIEKGITFSEIIRLSPELCSEILDLNYILKRGLLDLLNKNVDFFKIMELPAEQRSEILEKGEYIARMLPENEFSKILELPQELKKKLRSISYLSIMGISLSDIRDCEPELLNKLLELVGTMIGWSLPKSFSLKDLSDKIKGLEPSQRSETIRNIIKIIPLLDFTSLQEILDLKPIMRNSIIFASTYVARLLKRGISLKDITRIDLKMLSSNSLCFINQLLEKGLPLSKIYNIEKSDLDYLAKNKEVFFLLLSEGMPFDEFMALSLDRKDIIIFNFFAPISLHKEGNDWPSIFDLSARFKDS